MKDMIRWNTYFFLALLLYAIFAFSGCGKMENQVNKDYPADEVKDFNSYFPQIEEREYKGDFTFTDERDTKTVSVRYNYLGSSKSGRLYQIKFDVIPELKIPNELLDLGYFYVREMDIIRFKTLSQKQIKKILSDNVVPENASIVCQLKPQINIIQDGIQEEIKVCDNLIEYCYSDNSVSTNFYETIIWKRNIGIILYRRGYAAELDSITLWLEEYVKKPHEFSIE